MRPTLILIALGTSALISWLLLSTPSGSAGKDVSPKRSQTLAASPASDAELERRQDEVLESRTQVEPAAIDEPQTAALAAQPSDRSLSGTLSLIDPAAGTTLPVSEGSLMATLITGIRFTRLACPVREGLFEVRVPDGVSYITFRDPTQGDEGLVLSDPGARYAPDPGERIALTCYRPPSLVLAVKDLHTRRDLADVEISYGGPASFRHPGNPGRLRRIAQGASPLVVRDVALARQGTQRCHVHSPGYAWAVLAADFSSGGEREVLLERGATLAVEVVAPAGATHPRQTHLRVRPTEPGAAPLLELALPDEGRVVLEDLPAGRWRVCAELGTWSVSAEVLAEREVELVPGSREQIHLFLSPPAEPLLVALSGTVGLPLEWDIDRPTLTLFGDGALRGRRLELHEDETDPSRWHWTAGEVETGPWTLFLGPVQHTLALELEGPRTDVHMEVGPPSLVTVRAMDQATGSPVRIEGVLWSGVAPGEGGTWLSSLAPPGDDGYSVTLRAPRGELRVMCQVPGHYSLIPAASLYGVRDPTCEIVVPVRRCHVLEVELMDGDTPVPNMRYRDVQVTCLTGEGKVIDTGGALPMRFEVDEAGTYRIEVPELEGFEPLEPFEVQVGDEGARERVQLTRK